MIRFAARAFFWLGSLILALIGAATIASGLVFGGVLLLFLSLGYVVLSVHAKSEPKDK